MKPASTKAVATNLGKSERYARRLLIDLESRGLVERVGQRGGWKWTPNGAAVFSPPPPHSHSLAAGPAAGVAGGAETTGRESG